MGRQHHNHRVKRLRGFTLLEVMVALAVIAIGLGAVITEASRNINNAALLEDKTLGHWVAANKIAEMQVTKEWPSVGEQSSDVEMAGRDWYLTVIITEALGDRLRRIDVEVRTDSGSENPVVSVASYLGQLQP